MRARDKKMAGLNQEEQDLMNLPTSFRMNLKSKKKKYDDLKGLAKLSVRKRMWRINTDGQAKMSSFSFAKKKK